MCTDRFQSYNGVVLCVFRYKRIEFEKRFANGKVYINGIEGFWPSGEEHLMKYRAIDPARFPFYLKELMFGENFRAADLFDQLIETLGEYTRVAVTK